MATTDTLEKDMKQLREDFSALRNDLQKVARDAGSEARERVNKGAGAARRQAQRAGQMGQDAADYVDGQVRSHPWQTVGLALATGFVLSWLIRR